MKSGWLTPQPGTVICHAQFLGVHDANGRMYHVESHACEVRPYRAFNAFTLTSGGFLADETY
jgi:hypothetical protein